MHTSASTKVLRVVGSLLALPLVLSTFSAALSGAGVAETLPDLVEPVNAAPAPPAAPAAPKPVEVARPKPAAPAKKLSPKAEQIFEAEQRLADLGYWTGPVDGTLDAVSRSAVMAFQKVEGRKRTGVLTPAELDAMRAASRPAPLDPSYAHVEVDIARQVLFFVDDAGTVSNVLPVSTGNGKVYTVDGAKDRAYTPRGKCTVYRKIAGVRKAPLGSIYDPNYIIGGIAIHGSPSIPAQAASHGCVRIPMWSSKKVGEMIPVGTVVIIHEAGSLENDAAWLKKAARYAPENYENLSASL